jgi:hypothetical protein
VRLGTKEDVRKLFNVESIRTIDRMRLPRVPIQVKPGQRPLVRFDLDEIEAIIEKQKQEARGLAA